MAQVLLPGQPIVSRRTLFQPIVAGSAPFDPGTLSPQIWLPSSALASMADGDPIGTWANDGSASMDATQATSSKRATKQTVGGNAMALFDGVDDDFVLTGFSPGGDNSDISLFVVVYANSASPTGILDSAPSSADTYRNYPGGNWEWHANAPDTTLSVSSSVRTVLTFTSRLTPGREVKYRRDGVAISTNTNGSTTQMAWANPRIGTINAGANGVYTGYIEELLLFSPRLSDADRDLVEGVLL